MAYWAEDRHAAYQVSDLCRWLLLLESNINIGRKTNFYKSWISLCHTLSNQRVKDCTTKHPQFMYSWIAFKHLYNNLLYLIVILIQAAALSLKLVHKPVIAELYWPYIFSTASILLFCQITIVSPYSPFD